MKKYLGVILVLTTMILNILVKSYVGIGVNGVLIFLGIIALIKGFKQGIGRLIRSKTDSGTITILDNRVITKKYGKYFMDSITTKNINILSKSEILKDIIRNSKGGKKWRL